jgi:hypothetical protein
VRLAPQAHGEAAAHARPSAPCPQVVSAWLALYDGAIVPPAVAGTDEPACVPGPDDAGLSLVSNSSADLSMDRAQLTIGLPNATSYDVGGFAGFFVSVAVTGVSCSMGGQSVLRIELAPPAQPNGAGAAAAWQVRAPIFDLVPAGSCDPQCQNSSSLVSFHGQAVCEDDAVIAGPNGRSGAPVAYLGSGDIVRLTLAGGGHGPLVVYLNDTTNPGQSTSWGYPASEMAGGAPVEPWPGPASAQSVWTFGGTLSAGWTSCPVVNASSDRAPCSSYQGPAEASTVFPELLNSSYFSPGSDGYTSPYSAFATWSSSGGCSGDPGVVECADFASDGGQGLYPTIGLVASGGRSFVAYGTPDDLVRPLAGPASGYLGNGSASVVDPSFIDNLAANVSGTAISLSARATDPRGIDQVEFGALWCFTSGSNLPTWIQSYGAEELGAANGSSDGTWTIDLPRGSNTTDGTLFFDAVVLQSPALGPGPTASGAQFMPGTPPGCTVQSPPAATVLGVTAIGSGYRVAWSFPTLDSLSARNFSLIARPQAGGPAQIVPVPDPSARVGTLSLPPPFGGTYTVYVGTTGIDSLSSRSSGTLGGPTLFPLGVVANLSGFQLDQPDAAETVTASIGGGAGPYCLTVAWGDSVVNTTCGPGPKLAATHVYAGYIGDALVQASVNDSAGESANAAAELVVVRATPLGVPVRVVAGDGLVDVSWSSPVSPSSPVTGYEVFFTNDPVSASDLTSAWPSNRSAPHPVFLRNTTSTSLSDLPVADGSVFFVEVIAWNSWGGGLAPSYGPSEGRPAPLTVAFAPPPIGGAAPYTTTLSAVVTSGSPDPLTQAVFYSGLGPSVPGTVNTVGMTSYVNATFTFPHPGLDPVTVHVIDSLDDGAANTTTVFVGVGLGPLVTLGEGTPTAYTGLSVTFQATVTDGIGPYQFAWAFGDGATATGSRPTASHAYSEAGLVRASVTVTDNGTGGSTSADRVFLVFSLPTVSISASAAGSGGLSFSFQAVVAGGSGPSMVAWRFGDGATGAGAAANHTYGASGLYTVNVTSTDPAGTKASAEITVFAGSAKSSVPFLGGSFGVDLLVLALALVVVLAVATVYLALQYRRVRVLVGEPVKEPMYGDDRPPRPVEAAPDEPPKGPPPGSA